MSLSVAAVMGSHVHYGLPCLGAWDSGYPVCLKLMFPKRKIVVSSWGVLCEVCAPCMTWIYQVLFMKCNWKVKPWLWSCNIFKSWFSLTSTWEPYMLLRYFKRLFFYLGWMSYLFFFQAMLQMINVDSVMSQLTSILHEASLPRDPNHYKTGFWGRAQVCYLLLMFLLVLTFTM